MKDPLKHTVWDLTTPTVDVNVTHSTTLASSSSSTVQSRHSVPGTRGINITRISERGTVLTVCIRTIHRLAYSAYFRRFLREELRLLGLSSAPILRRCRILASTVAEFNQRYRTIFLVGQMR